MTGEMIKWLRGRYFVEFFGPEYLPTQDTSVSAWVENCPQGRMLIWIACRLVCYSRQDLSNAVKPVWWRAVTCYMPVMLDQYEYTEQALRLRSLSDELTISEVLKVLEGIQKGLMEKDWLLDQALARTCFALDTALEGALDESVEWVSCVANDALEGDANQDHLLCAQDVRRGLPDLAQQWERVLKGSKPPLCP